MDINYTSIIIAISAAILSGMGTAIIAGLRDNSNAIQELISVKSELEETLLKLSFIDHQIEDLESLDREF